VRPFETWTWRRTRQRGARLLLVAGLALATAGPARAPLPARAQDDDLAGRTATIARSDDGVNLRAEPGFGGDVIGVLPDGTVVELRIDVADTVLDEDGETRWWPVLVDGQEGWIAGYYLDEAGAADESSSDEDVSADPEMTEEPADTDETDDTSDDAITGTTATARVTSEDGANLRAEASASSDVLAVLPFDAVVSLRIDEADTVVRGGVRWWPVQVDGQDGWIAGDYLADAVGAVVEDDGATDEFPVSSSDVFSLGEYVAASTDTGDGLNIRVDAGVKNEKSVSSGRATSSR
jgi:hypothetical protein